MKQKTTKESIKTKTESGYCFCIRITQSIKLRLIVMSTNLEYRGREGQNRKSESRRQVSEAQREKERRRARVRDIKQRRHFLLKGQHENFVAAGGKREMLAATKVKMNGSEKAKGKKKKKHGGHFLHKACS